MKENNVARYALKMALALIALVVALAFLYNSFFGVVSQKVFAYRIVDGDTFEDDKGTVYRLVGINTPEKGELCADEATNFLNAKIWGKNVDIVNYGKEKYGRTLAEVYFGGANINEAILKEGLANAYYGANQNINWKEYLTAEKEGRERGGCVWRRSAEGRCIIGERKGKGFVLENVCDVTIVTQAIVRDTGASHRFKKNFEIAPRGKLEISEECGEDKNEKIYLCQHVFNNEGDELLIYDNSGLIVYVPYGIYVN